MIQFRMSVQISRIDGPAVLAAARLAERAGLGTLWLGDPTEERRDATGAVALVTWAGAIAATTNSLRIGLFVRNDSTFQPLRLAEDLAVLDHLSAGRIEIGFAASQADDWTKRAAAVLDAWDGWRGPDGEPIAIVPQPLQPCIPCLVAGPIESIAALRHWPVRRLVRARDATGTDATLRERRVLLLDHDTLRDCRTAGAAVALRNALERIRASAAATAAQEIMVPLDPAAPQDWTLAGAVIAPALRCSPGDVAAVVNSASQQASRPPSMATD